MPLSQVLCILSALMVGLALLLSGFVLLFGIFPTELNKRIDQEITLRNGSDAADRFIRPPAPAYLSFYFFNVTNRDAVNFDVNTIPILRELGPYVFRKESVKDILEWKDDLGTVRYTTKSLYYFEPDKTNGKLYDKINHVNAFSVGMKNVLESIPFAKFLTNGIRGKLVESHSVDELLFKGFDVQEYYPEFVSEMCKTRNNCLFGFFQEENGTISKEYEVSSGVLGTRDITEVKSYNNNSKLPYWFGDQCNKLQGTDAHQFPPGLTTDQKLYVFNTDVCRSLKFQYDKKVTVEEIPAYRFVLTPSVFADPNKDKNNMCYCQNDTNGSCPLKAGVLSVKTCKDGNPVVSSNPHFCRADPEYSRKFSGLNCVEEKHQTFLDIEPLTGTVVSAAKRIQFNIALEPKNGLPFLNGLKELLIFPVFWVEESGIINHKSAIDFEKQVLNPYLTARWTLIAFTSFGVILTTLAIALCYFRNVGRRIRYVHVDK